MSYFLSSTPRTSAVIVRVVSGRLEGVALAGRDDLVAVGSGNVFDQAMEAESAEVAAHLSAGDGARVAAEQWGEMLA
ncbi:hypothetical protein [Frankia sp. QA3]|uniref:hypothetical protein n=1 Tax=Frankia sp. QA3 TaxID=710111 RepID=UPI0012F909ED|nr:hypothetical protein [Frankia sp. QA3]